MSRTNTNQSIRENALLANLSISTWTARKFDKVVTNKVIKDNDAKSNSARVNKALFVDGKNSYTALTSYLSSLRTRGYKLTLPYNDSGERILVLAKQAEYRQMVTEGIRKVYDELLPAFIEDYPELKRLAKESFLGGMWKESDYPPVSEIRGKFGISIEYNPMPSTSFSNISDAAAREQLEREANERFDRRIQSAMSNVWTMLYEVVEHMHERLADPSNTFKDSLTENVLECCDLLTSLNITGDTRLETLRQDVKNRLLQYTPDRLRNSRRTRKDVANAAHDIMQQLMGSRMIQVKEPKSKNALAA